MEQLYPSQSCTTCPPIVKSRRRYLFTDQIDQLIRETYLNHRDVKKRLGVRLLAKRAGMPHWALKKRARELGLARTKELPWSEPELGILERYAWMSDERIRLKLKSAGYVRTAIHLKLKPMRSSMPGASTPPIALRKRWGSSLEDLREFPDRVQDYMGYALYIAQRGGKHRDTKPLRGFGGAGVVVIVKDHHGDTFRTVYTVKSSGTVYVLHAFHKKSKTGRETPRREMELIKHRLRKAEHIAREIQP